MPVTTRWNIRAAQVIALLAAAVSPCPAAAQSRHTPDDAPHLGFDAAHYPGDSVMRAWRSSDSPYEWVGYYLAAPCRRDSSWVGHHGALAAMGWGLTAIYVGQQDWTQHARATNNAQRSDSQSTAPAKQGTGACASKFLTADQGASEAADAVARMRADGFAPQSIVYLDVELVTVVTPALRSYVNAWIDGVLRDGRYRPGVYCAKANAQTLYDAALARFRAAGKSGSPPFWVASTAGFETSLKPTDIGLSFAQIWQGKVGVTQRFGDAPLQIDVNVAARANPSAP